MLKPASQTTSVPLTTTAEELRAQTSKLYLSNDGDGVEQRYWPALNDGFPNYERFWRVLVVPTTRRIENGVRPEDRIKRREEIAEDLWLITYVNYSLFLNLVGAYEHLSHPLLLSVGNFYTHLASACNLADDFLFRVHVCVSECQGEPVEFSRLSKIEFLDRAGAICDKQYEKQYAHTHGKGQAMPIYIPPGNTVRYQKNNPAWKDYVGFRDPIRDIRNKAVHDVQFGTIPVGKINMIPRPSKIKEYPTPSEIEKAMADPEILRRDFVVREGQMFSDFGAIKQKLNALWEKPITDLEKLLYDDKNEALSRKYNLTLS